MSEGSEISGNSWVPVLHSILLHASGPLFSAGCIFAQKAAFLLNRGIQGQCISTYAEVMSLVRASSLLSCLAATFLPASLLP